MKLSLTAQQLAALKKFLSGFEDAEQLSEHEYVVDLYEQEPPLSIDLTFLKDDVRIEGAAVLKYDEEMDGWYISDRIEQPEPVLRAFEAAGAFGQ